MIGDLEVDEEDFSFVMVFPFIVSDILNESWDIMTAGVAKTSRTGK
jgi:hypothetical protein